MEVKKIETFVFVNVPKELFEDTKDDDEVVRDDDFSMIMTQEDGRYFPALGNCGCRAYRNKRGKLVMYLCEEHKK